MSLSDVVIKMTLTLDLHNQRSQQHQPDLVSPTPGKAIKAVSVITAKKWNVAQQRVKETFKP